MFNVGTGAGHSVLEVISYMAVKVIGLYTKSIASQALVHTGRPVSFYRRICATSPVAYITGRENDALMRWDRDVHLVDVQHRQCRSVIGRICARASYAVTGRVENVLGDF